MNENRTIVMTAFEPSGDEFAGAVAAQILKNRPGTRIIGWGGGSMEKAGVSLIGRTSDNPAMGLGAISKIREVRGQVKSISEWMESNKFDVYVPVDSPAVNFHVCALARKYPVKIVHLVAPQLWAWGEWRVPKLKRLTDLVLCILPFEPEFFQRHKIPSVFIGHHVLSNWEDAIGPKGIDCAKKIIILPGSREQEVSRNFKFLIKVFEYLYKKDSSLVPVVGLANSRVSKKVQKEMGGVSLDIRRLITLEERDPFKAMQEARLALAVSGTVTLNLVRLGTPMVVCYRVSFFSRLISKLLLKGKYQVLPNIILNDKIVPEFVPCGSNLSPVIKSAEKILNDSDCTKKQLDAFSQIKKCYFGYNAAQRAASEILNITV